MLHIVAVLAAALLASSAQPIHTTAATSNPQTWLVLSDVHLDPFDRSEYPAPVGSDTNLALLDETIAQMKHFVPNPSLVLLPGDFLAHGFPGKAHDAAPAATVAETALRTMQRIASSLGKAYPHAHFAIALGNNDASCGDYRTDAGDRYLQQLARIWEPLVNRAGSAPDFLRRFSTGGYYTAQMPMPGLRLVVLNTVPMSSQYRGNCGPAAPNFARNELAWLHAALAATPAGVQNVVMMHIPPGYDPISTQYAHGFLAWSFLQSGDNATLLSLLKDPSDRVRFAIAGHMHHLDFRLIGRVPVLVFGSLSPVYRNNPAYFAMHVGGGGAISDIDVYSYDEWSAQWASAPRSFDAQWNVRQVDAQSLTALHERLGSDESLRARWAIGAVAWPSNPAFKWASWTQRWRIPWCAQTLLAQGYPQCADIEGRVTAFRAAVAAVAAAFVGFIVFLTAVLRKRQAR